MNSWLLAIFLIVLGIGFESKEILMVGIAGVGLVLIAQYWSGVMLRRAAEERAEKQSSAISQAKPKKKYRLMQAEPSAWTTPESKMMQGMMGPMSHTGQVDPLGMSRVAMPNSIVGSTLRGFLPFSNYGRSSVLEQVFMGMPIGLGSFIYGPWYKKWQRG